MTGSAYNEEQWQNVRGTKVTPSSSGNAVSCSCNSATNIDVVLTDDVFIRSIEVLVSGGTFGDTISIQVIDTNGITGAPAGTVLLSPATGWNVQTDVQKTLEYQASVPRKALASFTIRVIYNSTAIIGTVKVAVNYQLLKILS